MEAGIRHTELGRSKFSFHLPKVQTEKGIGILVGKMTNKGSVRVIKKRFLLSSELERRAREDYVKFKDNM